MKEKGKEWARKHRYGGRINSDPLDGISNLSKALRCWVRGLVCTNEL
jgi:hypothetical protein